jgi:hypothetical protein
VIRGKLENGQWNVVTKEYRQDGGYEDFRGTHKFTKRVIAQLLTGGKICLCGDLNVY